LDDVIKVLVSTPRQVDEQDRVTRHVGRALDGLGNRMRAFQRGQDALQPAQRLEGVERLVVGGVGVLGARNLPQMGVLRPDGRVIQPGADAVRRADATVGILQYIGTDRKSTRLNSSHVKISYAVF